MKTSRLSKKKSYKIKKILTNKLNDEELLMLYFIKEYHLNNSNIPLNKLLHLKKDKILPSKIRTKDIHKFNFALTLKIPIILNEISKKYTKMIDDPLFEKNIYIATPNKRDLPYIKEGGTGYLKRLIDKGDKPITGNDVKILVDDITKLLDKLQYTPKGDNGLIFMNLLLKLFRGQEDELDKYLNTYEYPKYYTILPPAINFEQIKKELPHLAEYLTAMDEYKQNMSEYKRVHPSTQTVNKSSDDNKNFIDDLTTKIMMSLKSSVKK